MAPMSELERQVATNEYTARELDDLFGARRLANQRTRQQADHMRRRYAVETGPEHQYTNGDMVKLKNHSANKLDFNWKGPYHIVGLGHPGTYWLMDPQGRWLETTYNESDLTPWLAQLKDNEKKFYDGTRRSTIEEKKGGVLQPHTL
ncbi:hypothetical protein BASA60_010344 [Batrachochytrium salamandrivorans]|nr:hypothetical protein BASA60_010344 [Batrachochytrium salamandrivorans]